MKAISVDNMMLISELTWHFKGVKKKKKITNSQIMKVGGQGSETSLNPMIIIIALNKKFKGKTWSKTLMTGNIKERYTLDYKRDYK